MAGDDQRHGIGGVRAAHSACRFGVADFVGYLAIGAGAPVGDGEDDLQHLDLKGA